VPSGGRGVEAGISAHVLVSVGDVYGEGGQKLEGSKRERLPLAGAKLHVATVVPKLRQGDRDAKGVSQSADELIFVGDRGGSKITPDPAVAARICERMVSGKDEVRKEFPVVQEIEPWTRSSRSLRACRFLGTSISGSMPQSACAIPSSV
jgi:hypothetical protein